MSMVTNIRLALAAALLATAPAAAQPEPQLTDWRMAMSRQEAFHAELARYTAGQAKVKKEQDAAYDKLAKAKEDASKLPEPFRSWQINDAWKQYHEESKQIAAEAYENGLLYERNNAAIKKNFFEGPGDQLASTHPTPPHDGKLGTRFSKGQIQVQLPGTGQWVSGYQVQPGVYRVQIGGQYRNVAWQNGQWVRLP